MGADCEASHWESTECTACTTPLAKSQQAHPTKLHKLPLESQQVKDEGENQAANLISLLHGLSDSRCSKRPSFT